VSADLPAGRDQTERPADEPSAGRWAIRGLLVFLDPGVDLLVSDGGQSEVAKDALLP
jgi:hypothetical protein